VNSPRVLGLLLQDSWLYWNRFEQRARALDLTLPQCEVLLHLASHEGVSQVRLAKLMDIEPMTLVRTLNRLETGGRLERRHDPSDRRARHIYLKAEGKQLLDEIWRLLELTRQEAFTGIPKRDAALVIAVLGRMQSNLASLQSPPHPAGGLRRRALVARKGSD
jgi:MarR family transcriptional regulator, transcriptional regulator for hemolysin